MAMMAAVSLSAEGDTLEVLEEWRGVFPARIQAMRTSQAIGMGFHIPERPGNSTSRSGVRGERNSQTPITLALGESQCNRAVRVRRHQECLRFESCLAAAGPVLSFGAGSLSRHSAPWLED